jgi:hypothetical protein
MFAQTARVRRIAAQLLLAWLFALATGIVHACVIAPAAHAPAMAVPADPHATAQPVSADHRPGCGECPDPHPAGASQACAKFCADESTSVRVVEQAFDPWTGLDIAVVPTMALSDVALAPVPAQRHPDAPPSLARVPAPIAFLRLMR